MKQKLATVEGGKKVVEWARDEALRAKEEAYDLGVAETQATLKAQVPGGCRL